jgi:hypothetical protein
VSPSDHYDQIGTLPAIQGKYKLRWLAVWAIVYALSKAEDFGSVAIIPSALSLFVLIPALSDCSCFNSRQCGAKQTNFQPHDLFECDNDPHAVCLAIQGLFRSFF